MQLANVLNTIRQTTREFRERTHGLMIGGETVRSESNEALSTLPSHYKSLGIDYEALSAIKPDIIWASISAMGPKCPAVPGYGSQVNAKDLLLEFEG